MGDDVDADTIFDYLHGYTMDKTGLKRCRNEQTGQAYIFVQQDGNSMISIMSGANNALTPQIIALNEELFANARWLPVRRKSRQKHFSQHARSVKINTSGPF